MVSVPECLECGVCCFSQLRDYVRVTGDDYERLAERAASRVHFSGNRAYLTMLEGRCASLNVLSQSGQFHCDSYAVRPEVCRTLERGSPACLGEIAAKATRPRQALERLRRG